MLQQQTWSVLTQIWLTLLHQQPSSRCVRRGSRRSVSVTHHSWHQAQLCMLPISTHTHTHNHQAQLCRLPTSTYTQPSTAAQSYVRPRPAPSPSHSLVACEWLAHPCNELTAMICMVDHISATVCHEVPSFHILISQNMKVWTICSGLLCNTAFTRNQTKNPLFA